MAPDRENFRGLHAVRVLTGQSGLTLDKLIEIAYDTYLPGFEELIPGLVRAYDESGEDYEELGPSIEMLRVWDRRVSANSVAMSLAHFYGLRYREEGSNPQKLSGMELINYFGTSSPNEERLQIFSATINALESDFGSWATPWGEINRFQRLTGDIDHPFNDESPSQAVGMASGRWGALGSFGAVRYKGSKRIYGTSGNSFVAVVEFGDRIKAKSLLAGGQSGNPESPHFNDQVQRYIDKDFKEVAFYKADVERRATRTYHPGESLGSE